MSTLYKVCELRNNPKNMLAAVHCSAYASLLVIYIQS